ncbi:pentapeptide repeat-containing protein [Micromonospora sp. NPDC053740]|uniref:pentapeptide repeat-containing protein n=1 Tax=Micromonospora sp. NPDC053740 TaxID=3155173 RepID=UPI003430BCBB
MQTNVPRHRHVRGYKKRHRVLSVLIGMLTALTPTTATMAAGIQPSETSTTSPQPSQKQSPIPELEQQKLKEEVRKLKQENERTTGIAGWLALFGPALAVLVGIIGLVLTFWKQISENSNQNREFTRLRNAEMEERKNARIAEKREREADRQQRETESLRRFDENLAITMQNLGSGSEALQLNAAAALSALVRPRHDEFLPDLITVTIANLKIEHSPAMSKLLVTTLQRCLHRASQVDGCYQMLDGLLDLSRSTIPRINLEGIDLSQLRIDIAYASMKDSNFTNSSIPRALGYAAIADGSRFSNSNLTEARLNKISAEGAHFHRATLVSASLKEAKLKGAGFQQAKLQSAHFEGADLRGARFERANVNNAYFTGATLDSAAIESLRLSYNWQNAHFDQSVADRLRQRPA